MGQGFCLLGARSLPVKSTGWTKGARVLPPKVPALSLTDWEDNVVEGLTKDAAKKTYICWPGAPVFIYKVLNSTIYVNHDHHKDPRYKKYREAFLEMLMISIWLYNDFPDVNLYVDFSDHSQLCDHPGPFLKFSAFNSALLGTGYNITELLAPGWVTSRQEQLAASELPQYTRGFTMPSPEAWLDFSLAKEQLLDYSTCMDTYHPWSSKTSTIFWRGQATGCSRGWPMQETSKRCSGNGTAARRKPAAHSAAPNGGYDSEYVAARDMLQQRRSRKEQQGSSMRTRPPYAHRRRRRVGKQLIPGQTISQLRAAGRLPAQQEHPADPCAVPPDTIDIIQQPHILRNKRVQLALMSFPYHYLDVKVTSLPRLTPDCLGTTPDTDMAADFASLAKLVHGEGIGMEGWSDHRVALSVDGYGPPYRLPQQLLAGQVVLRMQSPYQTWFEHHLQAGTHVFEFEFDLSNFLLKAGQLKGLLDVNLDALKAVSDQARAVAIDVLDVFAQLDSFAWSVARIKELQQEVPVELPTDGNWQVLQLAPSDILNSKGVPPEVHRDIIDKLHRNLKGPQQ